MITAYKLLENETTNLQTDHGGEFALLAIESLESEEVLSILDENHNALIEVLEGKIVSTAFPRLYLKEVEFVERPKIHGGR